MRIFMKSFTHTFTEWASTKDLKSLRQRVKDTIQAQLVKKEVNITSSPVTFINVPFSIDKYTYMDLSMHAYTINVFI
jgi:hypothetical protein